MTALHSLIGQDVNCESVQGTIRWLGPFDSSIQDLAPDENMRPDHAPSSPLKSPSAAAIAARTWLSDWVNFR